MSFNLIIKTVSIWFVILVLAILNGGLREIVLIPELGSRYGFILSGILLSAMILVVTYFSVPLFNEKTKETYIIVGVSWLCLTVLFEFAFGYFALGKPLEEILSAYTFEGGNLWPVVLIVVCVAPLFLAKFRGFV